MLCELDGDIDFIKSGEKQIFIFPILILMQNFTVDAKKNIQCN